MFADQTIARSMHDLSAAAWFGGSLMGAIGLHGASDAMSTNADRIRVADVGWQRWQPWKFAALAVHVAGSMSLLWGNKGRLSNQKGAMTVNLLKVGAFTAALGADLYAAKLGRDIGQGQPVEVTSAVEPAPETPDHVAEKQQQLRIVQWIVPALTGLNIVLGAKMGEQQRPANLAAGVRARFLRS